MIRLLTSFLLIAGAARALGAPDGPPAGRINGAEAALQRALQAIEQRQPGAALAELDRLVAEKPNFRLAHLIRGDLLLARTRPIEALGNTGHVARERLEELRAEAAARRRAFGEQPSVDRVPRSLLRLDAAQAHVLLIDAARSRLYLYENASGTPRLVSDYYTTLGKRGIEKSREGDQKTPIGVYRVTSRIPGAKLPDLYGWGAFPISYPNEWDRRLGRTGYGIWLHGVPNDTYARAPQASDGCMALANPDLAELDKRIQVGDTPVIIAASVEWVSADAWRAERDAFMKQLESWRTDWESRNTERYLSHYASDFRSGSMDLAAWSTHKRRVTGAKRWIEVKLERLSAFRSPAQRDLVEVTFDQAYRSDRFSQRTRKRQYWVSEAAGRWKIAQEAPIQVHRDALPESYPGKVAKRPSRRLGS